MEHNSKPKKPTGIKIADAVIISASILAVACFTLGILQFLGHYEAIDFITSVLPGKKVSDSSAYAIKEAKFYNVTMTLSNNTEFQGIVPAGLKIQEMLPKNGTTVISNPKVSTPLASWDLMQASNVAGPQSRNYTSLTFSTHSKANFEDDLGLSYTERPANPQVYVTIGGNGTTIFNRAYNVTDLEFVPHFSIKAVD